MVRVDEVLLAARRRIRAGETVGLATVTATWGSAPRQPGAAMLVAADGSATGSVSGGCVESEVYDLAVEARVSGRSVRRRFGVPDDDAFAVGLTCGGTLEVFVEPADLARFAELDAVATAVDAGRPVALATVVDGPRQGRHRVVEPDNAEGSLGDPVLDAAVTADARILLARGESELLHYDRGGARVNRSGHADPEPDATAVFVAAYAPPPRMIVFGATDFAAAVARIGRFLGHHVTVCDARATFATRERFPDVDELVVDWPHRYLAATETDARTVVCVLTHDPRFDLPLLEVALRMPLGYLGAMGSRATHAARLAELRDRGLGDAELARLRSPVGLDLGGRTPEEAAVSIAAEIVATRRGGSGAPLHLTPGPIHPGTDPVGSRPKASTGPPPRAGMTR